MKVSRRGSRWAAALGISGVAVLGFAGTAHAGTAAGYTDCNGSRIEWVASSNAFEPWLTVNIKGSDGSNFGPLPAHGSMPAVAEVDYTIEFWADNVIDNGDGSWSDDLVGTTWATPPARPTSCDATTTSAAPSTTAAATTTTVTAPPTTGPNPAPPTTVPERTGSTPALGIGTQELPATGGRLTLTFWGAVALAIGASLVVLRRRFRPVA